MSKQEDVMAERLVSTNSFEIKRQKFSGYQTEIEKE